MRARTKRLYAFGLSAILVVAAVALASVALGRHADLFYTPQLLLERGMPAPGQRVRVGGYVEEGSLVYADNAEMTFRIVDGSGEMVVVSYTGIAPDLFREEQGVVATGTFDPESSLFTAQEILAKHDENYQPRELQDMEPPAAN